MCIAIGDDAVYCVTECSNGFIEVLNLSYCTGKTFFFCLFEWVGLLCYVKVGGMTMFHPHLENSKFLILKWETVFFRFQIVEGEYQAMLDHICASVLLAIGQ